MALTNISRNCVVDYAEPPPTSKGVEAAMKHSDHFRENAENCQRLAERAHDHPTYLRYKRMEDAWLSLADQQDWLDGETPPVPLPVGH
jgi:hypothetical protein